MDGHGVGRVRGHGMPRPVAAVVVAAALVMLTSMGISVPAFAESFSQQAASSAMDARTQATRDRIVEMARGEIGASTANGGCIKYGPCGKYDWCAMFVEWVWHEADVAPVPGSWVATDLGSWGQTNGVFKRRPSGEVGSPEPGDLAVYGEPGSGTGGHVSIVAAVYGDGTIQTIDGNSTNSAVVAHRINPTKAAAGSRRVSISGYVSPPNLGVPIFHDNDVPRFQSSGQVVAAPSLDGRLEMFVGGTDGVWHRWQSEENGGWSAWENTGGPVNAHVALGRDPDGRLELFATNDTQTDHAWQTEVNGGWSAWETVARGKGVDVAVVPNADGRLEVFLAGDDGIYDSFQLVPNGGWTSFAGIGGPANAHLATGRNNDGRCELFATNDTSTQQRWQTEPNGGWHDWSTIALGRGTDVALVPNGDGRLELLLAGDDGIYDTYQAEINGGWSPVTPTGGPANAQLAASRDADGRIEVVATNNQTTEQRYQKEINGGWSDWQPIAGGGKDINSTSNADGRLEDYLLVDQVFQRYMTTPQGDWTGWFPFGGPSTS